MRDRQSSTGPGRQDSRPVTVLFVGDPEIGDSLASVADERESSLIVTQFSPAAGTHRILSAEFDCLVLTSEADPDWSALSTLDAPIVLYGDIDSARDRPEVQQATAIVLEQRDPPDANMLLPTIRALTASTARTSRTDALEAVSAERHTAAAFLVDETGEIRWSSTELSTLLPREVARQLPETNSLYEQFATVFQQSDGTPVSGPPGPRTDQTERMLGTAVGEQVRYYRWDSYPATDDESERLEVIQDVTATVDSYDRLARFEDLVENAEDGLFILDARWQVEYANTSYANMLGYAPEQIVGTHVAQQLSPGEMRRAQEATERLIRGDVESAVVDLQLERDDGSEIEAAVHFWLRRTDGGEYAGLMGAVRDITDRKERERELERYETIIQALGAPVCAFDADGRFVSVNEAFENQTGYDEETVLGEPATVVMDETAADTAESLIAELRADDTRTTATFEMELRTRDCQAIPTECHLALLPDDDGGSVAVLYDISRLKRREKRLSRFASVVSHDLRNPLDVALGRVEVLPEVADVDPQTEAHLDEVYDSLKRMEHLIEDVLTITRQREETLDRSQVSIEAVARDAWQHVATDSATLRVVSSVEIQASRRRLLRLFENLFRNAVEHGVSGESSPLTVEVGTLETDWKAGEVGFYVADDGPGIPPEQRNQIFEDGVSTSAGGTGLGLTIVREIARAHGWQVTLSEGVDGGARFEFTGVKLAHEQTD
jgi:PAS domain S-box-containing protein